MAAPISGAAGRAIAVQAAAAGVGEGLGGAGVAGGGVGEGTSWPALGAGVGIAGLADGVVGEQAARRTATAATRRRDGVEPRRGRTGPATPPLTRSGPDMATTARRSGGAPRDAIRTAAG